MICIKHNVIKRQSTGLWDFLELFSDFELNFMHLFYLFCYNYLKKSKALFLFFLFSYEY